MEKLDSEVSAWGKDMGSKEVTMHPNEGKQTSLE